MGNDAETNMGVTQQVSNVAQHISHLPTDPTEYAAVEQRLVRRIDTRLLPVLIAMIVLKYVRSTLLDRPRFENGFIVG